VRRRAWRVSQGEAGTNSCGPEADSAAFPRGNPTGLLAINKLKAAYHTLEFLAKDLKFSSAIEGLEVTEHSAEGLRFVDVLVREGGKLVKYELKNAETFSFAAEVLNDVRAIEEAIGGGKVTADALRNELGLTLRYVFRGTKEESAAVVTKLLAKLKEAVGQDAAHVVDELKDTIVKYTNRSLPI